MESGLRPRERVFENSVRTCGSPRMVAMGYLRNVYKVQGTMETYYYEYT